jgi:uncharacterized protein (UPF0147 family)
MPCAIANHTTLHELSITPTCPRSIRRSPRDQEDLYHWVASVAPLHLSLRSFHHYVRDYDVAGKVRTAKLQGTFEETKARPIHPWHARLALHQII